MNDRYPKGKPPKRHYVYTHRTLSGSVFYVGKGSKRRAWDCKLRSEAWFDNASDGYKIHIVAENLSKKDALALEKVVIDVYQQFGTLINKKR